MRDSIRNGMSTVLLCSALLLPAAASAVVIDNGVAGDGYWGVNVMDAGDSASGTIDPVGGLGPTDVIFSFRTFYDNGLDGTDGLLSDVTTTSAFLSAAGEVTSEGTFPGPNGTINWVAVASIAPGSPIYQLDFSFSSAEPFGDTRIVNYLDEDVFGFSTNLGVELGTDGTDDFLLLTVDDVEDVGVAHAAGYSTANNMTYAGWQFKVCCSPSNDFSINPGQIVGLSSTTDARYPGLPIYGPADITSSFAFDFDPEATTATVSFTMGGSATGGRPMPIETTPVPSNTPSGLLTLMLVMLMAGLAAIRIRTV